MVCGSLSLYGDQFLIFPCGSFSDVDHFLHLRLTTILSFSNQTQKVAALCMEEQTLLEWSSEKNVEKLLPSVRLRAEAIHIPDIEVVPSLLFFLPDLCIPRKSRLGRIYIPISKKFCKWRKFAPFLGYYYYSFFLVCRKCRTRHTFKKILFHISEWTQENMFFALAYLTKYVPIIRFLWNSYIETIISDSEF